MLGFIQVTVEKGVFAWREPGQVDRGPENSRARGHRCLTSLVDDALTLWRLYFDIIRPRFHPERKRHSKIRKCRGN